MFIATIVVTILFAALLLASASGKLTGSSASLAVLDRVGVPRERVWMLATLEIAGALGLIAGLFWWPIGVAAAIGTILYFLGAIASHLRVRDRAGIAAPALPLALAIALLVLRLLSA